MPILPKYYILKLTSRIKPRKESALNIVFTLGFFVVAL